MESVESPRDDDAGSLRAKRMRKKRTKKLCKINVIKRLIEKSMRISVKHERKPLGWLLKMTPRWLFGQISEVRGELDGEGGCLCQSHAESRAWLHQFVFLRFWEIIQKP